MNPDARHEKKRAKEGERRESTEREKEGDEEEGEEEEKGAKRQAISLEDARHA